MDENNSNNNKYGIGGVVDMIKADKSMWLMKSPALVSRSLNNPSSSSSSDEPTRPVAKVILSIDPLHSTDDSSSTQFTMELVGNECGNAPKRYSMDMAKDVIPMSVFSESSQGKLSIEGKILNKFDLRLHQDSMENYEKICRERTNKYMTKSRQIQVIDNDKGLLMRPMPGMIIPTSTFNVLLANFVLCYLKFRFAACFSWVTSFAESKKKPSSKGSDTKRTRRDRGEMEDIMFKLFERQPNWTLRLLIQETDQPEQFLKDILKDLCVYNNKGTNQGSYELKPEYKRSTE
ncbi:hypothetical protein EZV62_025443 [Acer yangbiense]|uniref:TFIIF beta subunit HTH domain-containing protein n=1 Tax=Acer yangbiense TaxID=1000413 RepID=A0A5C7GXU8_9ROSI|nr:hypothetical protein EZV62_025443 [Acer yangbiense]